MSDQHHADEHSHTKLFMGVFAALLVLTALSFWAGMYVAEYAVMRLVMIVISCAKAMLVIVYFMHLKWEANWKYVLTVPAMLMSVYLLCMLVPDVGLRTNHYSRNAFGEPRISSAKMRTRILMVRKAVMIRVIMLAKVID